MKVAIVGSRSASDYEAWKKLALGVLPKNTSMIVSGGAKGVDAFAARLAEEMGLPLLEFKPNYRKYGRGAPLVRNTEIVNASDYVLAFPSKDSRGTLDAIAKARNARKYCECIPYNDY